MTHVAYASRACCRILGSTEIVAAVVPAQQTGPLFLVSQSASETQQSQNPNEANLGYCPHTVTVYNRATIKVLIYLYYEYYPTVTKWGSTSRIWVNTTAILLQPFRLAGLRSNEGKKSTDLYVIIGSL